MKLQGQISKIKEELSNANIKIKKMAFALETSKKETIKLCEEIQGLKMNIQEMETNAAGMKEKNEELVRKITHYESMAHDYERVIEVGLRFWTSWFVEATSAEHATDGD